MSTKAKQDRRKSLYLFDGQMHSVWTPRHPSKSHTGFTDIVTEVVKSKQDLLKRRQRLQSRLMATQQVLKVQREEMVVMSDEGEEENSTVQRPAGKKWQRAIKNVTKDNTKAKKKSPKKNIHFHDVVSQCVAAMSTSNNDDVMVNDESTATRAKAVAHNSLRVWRSQCMEYTKQSQKKHSSSVPMQATVQHEICTTIPKESEPTEDPCA